MLRNNIFLKIIFILITLNVSSETTTLLSMEDSSVDQLFRAMSQGRTDSVQRLIEQEPHLKGVVDLQGNTLLHLAVFHNNLYLVRFFIQKALPIDAQNRLRETPLCIAVANGHIAIVQELINNGAAIVQNSQHNLDHAIMHGQTEATQQHLNPGDPTTIIPGYNDLPQPYILAGNLADNQKKSAIVKLLINAQAQRLRAQLDRTTQSAQNYTRALQQRSTPTPSTPIETRFRIPARPAQPGQNTRDVPTNRTTQSLPPTTPLTPFRSFSEERGTGAQPSNTRK